MKKILLTLVSVLILSTWIGYAQKTTIKLLAIGNSFSEDAVEQELYPIAKADGTTMIIGNLYYSGCSVDQHVEFISNDSPVYSYRKIDAKGKKTTKDDIQFSKVINDEVWDYISVQQYSGTSGMLESYGNLEKLVNFVKQKNPQAKILFHQTWSYAKDATHPAFANYDKDQAKMNDAIKYASTKAARRAGATIIIPCQAAIQYARGSNPESSITRDGYHLDRRLGRYVASATWYAKLSGKKVSGNTYKPKDVTEDELKSAQRSADIAVFGWGPTGKNEPKVITPQTEKGIYEGHKNYGKSIAVFGGSLSVNVESNSAKQIWANELHSVVTTYGVGGAGFAKEQGYDLQRQVDEAGVHDIYVLWASTNDYTNSQDIGTWQSYTAYDGFDERELYTQCGGINYCIKTLLEKNPNAEIYFFSSLRFFSKEEGHNPFSTLSNATGNNFAAYIKGQKDCCEYYCIPILDQFNLQGINEYNYKEYYKNDSLHMNDEGYLKIGPVQAAFLADGK